MRRIWATAGTIWAVLGVAGGARVDPGEPPRAGDLHGGARRDDRPHRPRRPAA